MSEALFLRIHQKLYRTYAIEMIFQTKNLSFANPAGVQFHATLIFPDYNNHDDVRDVAWHKE